MASTLSIASCGGTPNTNSNNFSNNTYYAVPTAAPLQHFWDTPFNSSSLAHHTEKIIGEKNLIPVSAGAENLPSTLRSFPEAIGQLNIGCTATHVGNGLVLTAGHCISVSPRSKTTSCRQFAVVWGNWGGNTTPRVSKCISVEARVYDSSSDFALLKVSNPPATYISLDNSPQPGVFPRAVTMLSFPRMRPMEWSGECELRPYNKPEQAHQKFLHTCDSEGGSSGAAIIDLDTLKIVGVHGGASDDFNYGMFSSQITPQTKP